MSTTKSKFVTGKDCDSWCTKCKLDLAHVIVAMVEDLPVKVKCNTCGSLHKYRIPKAEKAAATAAKRKATAAAKKAGTATKKPGTGRTTKAQREAAAEAAALLAEWDRLVAANADTDSIKYTVKADLGTGDVIDHSKFGVGFVRETASFNRASVLFQEGEKTLVMRHGQKG